MDTFLDTYAAKSKRIVNETEEQFDGSQIIQQCLETEFIDGHDDDNYSDDDDRFVDYVST